MSERMLHGGLTRERWFRFSLIEQMANIGTEVGRTLKWRKLGKEETGQQAFERALELFYLTIEDPKNSRRLKELVRVRSGFADYYAGINEFGLTERWLEDYFYQCCYAAAMQRGR